VSFARYPKYKDSGVEWLGEVPTHWEIARIKASVASCRNGIWGSEASGDDEDIPCVRVADFDRNRLVVDQVPPTIRNISAREREGRLLNSGNLLLEKSGGGEGQPVGCIVLYDCDASVVCSNFVARMEMRSGMAPSFWRYVHAAAYSVRLTTRSINQTSGIQNLDQHRYFNERAAFPPAEEQSAIASFLDRETAKIDALIAEQEKLIALLKEKRQALISHAVTKGFDPNAPMKDSGIEWLGRVPAHWNVARLGTIFREVSDVGAEDLPILSVSIHDGISDKELDEAEMDRKVTRSEDRSKYKAVQPGDLAYNMMRAWQGGFGAVMVAGQVSPAYVVARPIGEVCTSFIEQLLRTPQAVEQMRRHSRGVTDFRLRLYWEEFKNIRVALPPLPEQHAILDAAAVETTKFDSLVGEAVGAIELLKERRAALISATVTGKIDVRNAT